MKKSLLLLALIGGAPLAVLTVYAADVKANWGEHCAKCHGDDGKGQTKMGRKLSISDMSDPKVQAKFTDEEAMKAMKEGVKDSAGKVTMKPIEGVSEPEMKELIAYLRALKK
jgi:cytochrome c553